MVEFKLDTDRSGNRAARKGQIPVGCWTRQEMTPWISKRHSFPKPLESPSSPSHTFLRHHVCHLINCRDNSVFKCLEALEAPEWDHDYLRGAVMVAWGHRKSVWIFPGCTALVCSHSPWTHRPGSLLLSDWCVWKAPQKTLYLRRNRQQPVVSMDGEKDRTERQKVRPVWVATQEHCRENGRSRWAFINEPLATSLPRGNVPSPACQVKPISAGWEMGGTYHREPASRNSIKCSSAFSKPCMV